VGGVDESWGDTGVQSEVKVQPRKEPEMGGKETRQGRLPDSVNSSGRKILEQTRLGAGARSDPRRVHT
jgi:hypothetical protein